MFFSQSMELFNNSIIFWSLIIECHLLTFLNILFILLHIIHHIIFHILSDLLNCCEYFLLTVSMITYLVVILFCLWSRHLLIFRLILYWSSLSHLLSIQLIIDLFNQLFLWFLLLLKIIFTFWFSEIEFDILIHFKIQFIPCHWNVFIQLSIFIILLFDI